MSSCALSQTSGISCLVSKEIDVGSVVERHKACSQLKEIATEGKEVTLRSVAVCLCCDMTLHVCVATT